MMYRVEWQCLADQGPLEGLILDHACAFAAYGDAKRFWEQINTQGRTSAGEVVCSRVVEEFHTPPYSRHELHFWPGE